MNTVYQLQVTLQDTDPAVWRRLLVPGGIHLGDLHQAIQTAMGWEDRHLHEFVVRGKPRFSWVDGMTAEFHPWDTERMKARIRGERIFMSAEAIDQAPEGPGEDEDPVTLAELCPEVGDTLQYVYDLGDHWVHTVTVERIQPGPRMKFPVCKEGQAACPPEDCGGPHQYAAPGGGGAFVREWVNPALRHLMV